MEGITCPILYPYVIACKLLAAYEVLASGRRDTLRRAAFLEDRQSLDC